MKAEMEIKKRCQGARVNFYGPKCRKKGKKTPGGSAAYMVERECRVAKDPGAMLEILLS